MRTWGVILVGLGLTLGVAGCTCNDSQEQCSQPPDCEGRTWTAPLCDEEDGHWECTNAYCIGVCDPATCQTPADCVGEFWPADLPCAPEDRTWDCQQEACLPVCDDEPPTGDCDDYTDCEGLPWPEPSGTLDCDASQGHWECPSGTCEAACNVECNTDAECADATWGETCSGNWDCIQGLCEEACDEVGCGDDTCDLAGGETLGSCPDDCGVTCGVPEDCVDLAEWDQPCVGRWSCEAQACVSTCDYATCGDGVCDAADGEDQGSCIVDCFDGTCQWPTDCTHQDWSQICQGRHTCFLGSCQQTCDSNGCGNGTCDAELGETSESCFIDCLGGPCDDVTDCLGFYFYETCAGAGRWQCDPVAGACEATCDAVACGDGTCDPLAGESTTSCPADCQQYDCGLTEDCDAIPLPGGCSEWVCLNRMCTPVCP